MSSLVLDYCGEQFDVPASGWLTLGRVADVVIDDNPYLHRRFLQVGMVEGLFWLVNVGDQLSASVSDGSARLHAWLAPGARLPLVFDRTVVQFTAGPTTYEFLLLLDDAAFGSPVQLASEPVAAGETTIGLMPMTDDQRLLVLSLAEPLLRQEGRGSAAVPSSAAAAQRLGWTQTKFNRKLDNVCQKLTKMGIRGMHGTPGELASTRRQRLVEYAVSTRLVTVEDLRLLDEATPRPSTTS